MGVRLHPINAGEIQLRVIDPRPPRRGPAKLPPRCSGPWFAGAQWYPVPMFLVEHPTAGPFLIDVAYDPSVAFDPTPTLGFFFGKVALKHRVVAEPREQVIARGVDPAAEPVYE